MKFSEEMWGTGRPSWRWLCERSALGELLGVDFERMSMMRLYPMPCWRSAR